MTRYAVLGSLALGLAIATGAQTSPKNQTGTLAQANLSAGASAGVSAQNQDQPARSDSQGRNTSASASSSGAASASAAAGNNSLDVAHGSRLDATLLTTLDAKHCKPGDRVVAKTTQNVKQNGRVVLRKGSRLIGHVTEASARSKNQAQSTLGVVFDQAVLKGGQAVPLQLSIQALAAAATETSAGLGDDEGALASSGQTGFAGAGAVAAPRGGLMRGAGGVAGGLPNTAGGFAGNAGTMVNSGAEATARSATSAVGGVRNATGGLNEEGQLTSNSEGVFGLDGLNLSSAAGSATDASVVTSATRNVHLASGTQMVLQVIGR